jgi:hypothetical protein
VTDEHHGELGESSYTFWCWTTCRCGWRSKSYRTSAEAWQAHEAHREHEEMWEAAWERFAGGER